MTSDDKMLMSKISEIINEDDLIFNKVCISLVNGSNEIKTRWIIMKDMMWKRA